MFWKKKNKEKEIREDNAGSNGVTAITALKVIIKTDLGNVRTNNEDAASFFRVSNEQLLQEKGYLMLVADGMGGHLAGEVASQMAVDVISETYYKVSSKSRDQALADCFREANAKIFKLASAEDKYHGMGTTCTALVVAGRNIYYAHAGDSRAYIYQKSGISRITEDHTYVQELVNRGEITANEAATHAQRNILTNAMGTKPDLRVDAGKFPKPLEETDRLMICSDGLYDYLTDEEIGEMLGNKTLEEAADQFIQLAKKRGGLDNITVVLAEVKPPEIELETKATREVSLTKETRDAEIPENISNL